MKKKLFIPNLTNCVEWGFYRKTHGFKGELLVEITHLSLPSEKKIEALFVFVDGSPVPFMIENFRYVNDSEAIVKHEEINTEEAAEFFANRKIYLPDYLIKKANPMDDLNALTGFVFRDEVSGRTGAVTRIVEMPAHPLLMVEVDGQEKSIPLVEALIVKIDMEKRAIEARLPEGLLDI